MVNYCKLIASLRAQRSVSNNSTGLQHYMTDIIENSTRKKLIETLDNKHLGFNENLLFIYLNLG